jgi:hypothetical protein
VFVVAVQVVAALFLFVQWGTGTETTLWLVQQGRKYVEAPRWAAIGVALVMLVFAWNVVGAAFKARRITGVMAVKTGKGRSAPTVEETRKIGCVLRKGAWQRLVACAVERQRFQVGASPTRQPLRPEATGAVMEITKSLKPLVSVSRYTVTARVCRP